MRRLVFKTASINRPFILGRRHPASELHQEDEESQYLIAPMATFTCRKYICLSETDDLVLWGPFPKLIARDHWPRKAVN